LSGFRVCGPLILLMLFCGYLSLGRTLGSMALYRKGSLSGLHRLDDI
jgi:hypothetical protein